MRSFKTLYFILGIILSILRNKIMWILKKKKLDKSKTWLIILVNLGFNINYLKPGKPRKLNNIYSKKKKLII